MSPSRPRRARQTVAVSVLVATLVGCASAPAAAPRRTRCQLAADRVPFPEGAWTTKLVDGSLGELHSIRQLADYAACRGDEYRRVVTVSVRFLGELEPLHEAGLVSGTSTWEWPEQEGRWASGVVDYERVEALARRPEVLELRFEPAGEPDG